MEHIHQSHSKKELCEIIEIFDFKISNYKNMNKKELCKKKLERKKRVKQKYMGGLVINRGKYVIDFS